MKVLIACEFSGTVRDAFIKKGHDAISCDLLDTTSSGPHYVGDVLDILNSGWDLVIAHPPCTYLTATGARWLYHPDDKHLPASERRPHPLYPNRKKDRQKAVDFFMEFVNCNAKQIAIENPVGYISTVYRKPDQIIQPYMFGDAASKATCLWLKNLPKLTPTNIVDVPYKTTTTGKRFSQWFWDTSVLPLKDRWHVRSKTFQGIANAMADQWG